VLGLDLALLTSSVDGESLKQTRPSTEFFPFSIEGDSAVKDGSGAPAETIKVRREGGAWRNRRRTHRGFWDRRSESAAVAPRRPRYPSFDSRLAETRMKPSTKERGRRRPP